MAAVMEVKDILQGLSGIDGIATLQLSDAQAVDVEDTIVLISEVQSNYTADYGSDRTTAFNDTVAINIFYGLSKTEQSDDLEQAIFDAMENAGWYQNIAGAHTYDPDTHQYSIAKQFTHRKERF